MRLDKYLKVSRLIKRRTIANEACDAGRVSVNGKTAKASTDVKAGDVVEIAFGEKTVKAEGGEAKSYKGNNAWTAISRVGKTGTATVKADVKQGSWNKDAYSASKLGDKKVKREIEVSISGKQKVLDAIQKVRDALNKLKNIKIPFKARGGVYSNGRWSNIPQYASGGVISARRFARNIPQYAAGGAPHGTAFVAGERGPEVVGHIGGRTEVLNKSQLAATMYAAVVNGMGEIGGRIGAAICNKIADSSNAELAAMYAIADQVAFVAPTIASGSVVPYAITKADLTELARTIQTSSNDLESAIVQAIAGAAAMIVTAVNNIDTGSGVDTAAVTRRTIDEINRRTLMFQQSPLL